MKKNFYYLSLILGLVLGMTMFTACGGDDDNGGGNENGGNSNEQTLYSILRSGKWINRGNSTDATITSYGGSISRELDIFYFMDGNKGYWRWSNSEYDTSLGRSHNNGWVSFNYYITDNSVNLTSFSNGSSNITLVYSDGNLISTGGTFYMQRLDITNDDEIYGYLNGQQHQNNGNNGVNDTQTKYPVVNIAFCSDGNHPHMIDLGLPSGTKWACCNVGSHNPEDYGSHYAWGEVETKSYFGWNNYQYGNSDDNVINIGSNIAGTQYDAATANWGLPWKMPTNSQCWELTDNTTSEWINQNGVCGRLFTSKKNGNLLFFPASGWRVASDLAYRNSECSYWKSEIDNIRKEMAGAIDFDSNNGIAYTAYRDYRYSGRTIRPVCK